MHRSGTGAATPTSGGKGDSSSSNLGDLESSDKSSVGSQDDKAHAALNIGELLQFLQKFNGNWNSVHSSYWSERRDLNCTQIFNTTLKYL